MNNSNAITNQVENQTHRYLRCCHSESHGGAGVRIRLARASESSWVASEVALPHHVIRRHSA